MHADHEPDGGYVIDAWWRRLPDRPATAGLIAVCVLAYTATLVGAVASSGDPLTTLSHSVWTLEGSEPVLIRLGALDLTRVWLDGQWWRVASAGLLHGFLIHLVLNVLALGSLGDWFEHAWGWRRTLVVFGLSSVAGCLASLVWCESNIVVGASAGALGLAGALWVSRRFGSSPVQQALEPISSFSLVILILVCLALGAFVPGIAQAGHIGGLVMGLLLGVTCVARTVAGRIASILIVGAALLAMVIVGSAPPWPAKYHLFLGMRALSEADTASATSHFEIAIRAAPEDAQLLNLLAYQLALDGRDLPYAESLALRALAIEPTNPNFLDTLAWALCRRGLPQPAQTLLHAALFLAREPVDEIAGHLPTCASSAVSVSRETL